MTSVAARLIAYSGRNLDPDRWSNDHPRPLTLPELWDAFAHGKAPDGMVVTFAGLPYITPHPDDNATGPQETRTAGGRL